MSLIPALASNAGVRVLALGLSVPTAAGLLAMGLCRFNAQASAATRRLLWMLAFVIMAVSAPVALLGIQLAVPILPAPIAGPVARMKDRMEWAAAQLIKACKTLEAG